MSRRGMGFGIVAVAILASQALPYLGSTDAADPPLRLFRILPWSQEDVGVRPVTGCDTCMENLARNIDWLEHQLDVYGTVVPKVPDVWGEARMTAHRQEFEQELVKELGKFNKNQVNGAEFVSDNAFLAFAFAMQVGQTGGNRVSAPNITINAPPPPASPTGSAGVRDGAPYLVLNMDNPSKVFGFDSTATKFGGAEGNIQLEQTEVLDQLARYINHLHEHRRINEGDDTSDAPGYAMNLVRIPISVLPGSATKHGYGAEVTITAEPYLGPELLPSAFRDFVINDLVDQLSLPLTRFVNDNPSAMLIRRKIFLDRESARQQAAAINVQLQAGQGIFGSNEKWQDIAETYLRSLHPPVVLTYFTLRGNPTGKIIELTDHDDLSNQTNIVDYDREYSVLRRAIDPTDPAVFAIVVQRGKATRVSDADAFVSQYSGILTPQDRKLFHANVEQRTQLNQQRNRANPEADLYDAVADFGTYLNDRIDAQLPVKALNLPLGTFNPAQLGAFRLNIPAVALPASMTRRATLPFPPSHLVDVYGMHELSHIVVEAYDAFQSDILNRDIVHITDVQALLREELGAAYELLRTDAMRSWWEYAATHPKELHDAIRLRQQPAVDRYRQEFLNGIGPLTQHHRSTASLAWCIYVESLLLNERLLQDMRETFGNQPSAPQCPQWMAFFGPDPCWEARFAFSNYVKVRWPIHVFHVDPVVTEQNIADIRSVYRQMQMAVALAFSQQKIGASAAMQAMRKLQRDRATFDLNRTVVGFGHGDDTFGWKFYPRFQTPPVESNVVVFWRDLLIGGPTDKMLECSKEIEPGQRECIAIILMPSFVPHVTFHSRSNWFKLNCAGHTASSVHDTVQYSRVVRQMEMNAMQCCQCAHLYRDGEVDRLLKRVHQLDRKLALQTLECQVPIENTHGGFEIFSAGTRELAPELVGWYGAPGYDPTRSCRLFFSGDNFNVATTKLIAGNQMVEFKLLSRQIMEATLPAGLPVIRDRKLDEAGIELYEGYVDAHVATPYGVSGHLMIPVVRNDALVRGRISMAPNIVQIKLEYAAKAPKKITYVAPTAAALGHLTTLTIPPELRSGEATEKIVFHISRNGSRLQSTTATSFSVDLGTDLVRVHGSQAPALFDSAALGAAIDGQLQSLGAVAAFPTVLSFEITAEVQRGTGATTITMPVDGTLNVQVAVVDEDRTN